MRNNQTPVRVRAFLEKVDGSFVFTPDVLKSPELRKHLTPNAKRQLRRILDKQGRK